MKVGDKVRTKCRWQPKSDDPFDGVIELITVPLMRDCALVKFRNQGDGLCIPRHQLEVENAE